MTMQKVVSFRGLNSGLDALAAVLSSSSAESRCLIASPTKSVQPMSTTSNKDTKQRLFEFPCLSFTKQQCDSSDDAFRGDRKQAQNHAIHLLERPVLSTTPNKEIQESFIASFGTLVESRIHAYTKRLGPVARDALRSLAGQLHANMAVTRLEVCSKRSPRQATICFVAALDIVVPGQDGEDETLLSVAMSTSGSIHGMSTTLFEILDSHQCFLFSPVLQDRVRLQLNVPVLLPEMIRQASRIAKAVVEVVSRPPTTRPTMSMPPPPPRPSKTAGLDLLGQAAASLAVVSPDLVGQKRPLSSIPCLVLNDDPVANLSIDQCVDIVDTCLTGFQKKRARTNPL